VLIAVTSDTHFTKDFGQLNRLTCRFSEADLVIHAGDYSEYWVLDYFRTHFKFAGVWGNVDDNKIKKSLKEKELLQVESFRIGIFHGHGKEKTTPERAYKAFENESVDAIVFGHSHQPSITTKNKVLMLNPGSLANKRRERWFSYILLNVSSSSLQANLIFFTDN
jgi:putative phosphoesterase